MYSLYAVLVHEGHSVHSGHYVCYVRAANGMWHVCDDGRVAQVSILFSVLVMTYLANVAA